MIMFDPTILNFKTPLSTELRKLKAQKPEGFSEQNRLNQDIDALNRKIKTIALAGDVPLPLRVHDGLQDGVAIYDEHVMSNAKSNLF